MIITIDGPSGTGKSSVAQELARRLNFIFMNTGAMYRAFTLLLLQQGVAASETETIEELLNTFNYRVEVTGGQQHYFCGDSDVTSKITQNNVTQAVSAIAALPNVRKKMVKLQQQMTQGADVVAEGRDMGTVVFPKAEIKIFLTASDEVRAQRRYQQLIKESPEHPLLKVGFSAVLQDIQRRDHFDSSRKHSPLKSAQGAVLVDTSYLSFSEVISKLIELKDVID
jgi:cytidylate kinase